MRKCNLVITDEKTGEVILNLKDVTIESSSFFVKEPSEKALVKVNATITGLLKEDNESAVQG